MVVIGRDEDLDLCSLYIYDGCLAHRYFLLQDPAMDSIVVIDSVYMARQVTANRKLARGASGNVV